MAYHSTSKYEPDDHADEHGYIAIGEVHSEADGQLASLTLFELGIPCEMAFGDSEVDEMRRFIEGWSAGQQLFVKPRDAARALAAVGSRLAPTHVWTTATLYLEQLPTEHLLKLLDFRSLWKEPALSLAAGVLNARGIQYPPDGATSRTLPVVCLLLGIWGGPFAGIMRWRIDKMRPTKEGGTRPHYTDKTRQKADRCLMSGFAIWCGIMLTALLVIALRPAGSTPPRHKRQPAKSFSQAD